VIKTLILVCSTTLTHSECSSETATAVIQGPLVQSVMTCGLHGQAYLAETALERYLDDAHYLQLICNPESAGRASTGTQHVER
jgi:hypothetical protein